MGRKRCTHRYVLWRGDEVVAMGTADELAERLGVSRKTIYYYVSPANARKDRGNRLVAVRI